MHSLFPTLPPAIRRPLLWAALVLSLTVASCRSTRTLPPPPPEPEPPAAEPARRAYTVVSFTGEVEGVSVNGQLRLAQDSAMWLSVNKVFELGRALATPDSVWVRIPLAGRDEALDYAGLRQLTQTDLTFDEMQAIVLDEHAEERLAALARQMGITARISITRRQQVDRLAFPYPKPPNP